MLHNDTRLKERVLVMGSWGTGKSATWCSIAKWLNQGKSENQVFVLDTDNAVDRMVWGEPYEDTVIGYDIAEWTDFRDSIDKARKAANPNMQDWLVIDMADKAWEYVQQFYIEQAFGKEADSFFLEWKKQDKSGSPLAGDYGTNWQVINQLYNAFMGKVIRFPGHVLACTPVDQLQQSKGEIKESQETIKTYGRFGIKPKGQKALGHQFHTLLLCQQKSSKGWTYTTVKDRKRTELKGEDVSDFVTSYLVKVGGWKL